MKGNRRLGAEDAASSLERAMAEKEKVKEEKESAEELTGLFQRLRVGWARVHERNNLAGLFAEDYGRTKG